MRAPLIWAEFLRLAETVFGPAWPRALPVALGVGTDQVAAWRSGGVVPEGVMSDLHERLSSLAVLYHRAQNEPDLRPALLAAERLAGVDEAMSTGYWSRICADAPEWTFPSYLERVRKQ